jgi:hypothetical protein
VPVVEPAPNAPTAAPPETRGAQQVKSALGLDAAQGRPVANTETQAAETTSTPSTVMPRRQKQRAEATPPENLSEEVSSSPRRSETRSHSRQHYAAALVRHSRGKRQVQAAAAEKVAPTPPPALAYDGRNENHSPFHSLGKVLGGAQ